VHERFHIGIVFFKEAMPTAIRYVLETIIHVATTAFGVAMIIYGLELADTTWTHIIPTLGIPVGLQYVPFGLSGGLIILFSLNHLADLFVNGLPPDMLGSKNPSEEGASE